MAFSTLKVRVGKHVRHLGTYERHIPGLSAGLTYVPETA